MSSEVTVTCNAAEQLCNVIMQWESLGN